VKIDPGSHVPIYRQIAEELSHAVAAGVYRPGESLPSQRAVAVEIQVNPNPIQPAYDELVRQGVAYVQRGKGLFVADQAPASAQDQAEQIVARALEGAVRTALAAGMSARAIRGLFQAALERGQTQESSSR